MADYQGEYTGRATSLNVTSSEGEYTDVFAQVWNVEQSKLGTTWSASLAQAGNLYKKPTTETVLTYTGLGGDQGVIHLLQQIDEWVQSWKKQQENTRANAAESSAGFLGVLLIVALIALASKGR